MKFLNACGALFAAGLLVAAPAFAQTTTSSTQDQQSSGSVSKTSGPGNAATNANSSDPSATGASAHKQKTQGLPFSSYESNSSGSYTGGAPTNK